MSIACTPAHSVGSGDVPQLLRFRCNCRYNRARGTDLLSERAPVHAGVRAHTRACVALVCACRGECGECGDGEERHQDKSGDEGSALTLIVPQCQPDALLASRSALPSTCIRAFSYLEYAVVRIRYRAPPPDDVLRACEAFAELNIPIRLRRFDDGMLVERLFLLCNTDDPRPTPQ